MKTLNYLIPLFFLTLFFVSCDSAGPDPVDNEKQVTYTVTNDLQDRLVTPESNESNTHSLKSASGYEILGWIEPPNVDNNNNTVERASHVTFNNNRLYVGHLIRGDGPGNGFGGGTDIIDVSNPDNPNSFGSGSGSANTLQVDNVDVQESTVRGNTLFLGVAEEPSLQGEVGSTPAEVHSIALKGNGYPDIDNSGVIESDEFDQREIDANLVKAVSTAPSGDSHEFYSITDRNRIFRFDVNTSNAQISDPVSQQTGTSGSNFRGLASNSDGGFIFDKNGSTGNGSLWQVENNGGFNKVKNYGTIRTFGGSEQSIARVTTGGPTCNGSKLVFVSLNRDGFSVLRSSPNSVAEVFRNSTLETTAVTATQNYVYVASGSEVAVFRVNQNKICNTSGGGLTQIGKAPVENWINAGSLPSRAFNNGQVNDIAAWSVGGNDYLAVAMGQNGVFVATTGGGTYP